MQVAWLVLVECYLDAFDLLGAAATGGFCLDPYFCCCERSVSYVSLLNQHFDSILRLCFSGLLSRLAGVLYRDAGSITVVAVRAYCLA